MNSTDQQSSSLKKIVTIPNAMSLFRFLLLPVFVWLYSARANYGAAIFVLLLSCLTDLCDGWVARQFNMVSDLGKMMDPVADKLTQGVILICLALDSPILFIPLVLLVVKECFHAVMALMVIRKSGQVFGAEWHGKVTTWLIDILLFVHVIWQDVPFALTVAMTVICVISMLVSLVLYFNHDMKRLKASSENPEA